MGRLHGGSRAALATPGSIDLLGELKGLPQKVGQHLAMKDVRNRDAFSVLLARGRPLSDAVVHGVLDAELPGWRGALVLERCLASGSIAQVYRARRSDEPGVVVVKVVHPGIERAIEEDVRGLERIAQLLLTLLPAWQRHSPADLASYLGWLRDAISREARMDLEAATLRRVRELVSPTDVNLPEPVEGLCGARVLTTSQVKGRPWLDTLEQAPRGARQRLLGRLMRVWLALWRDNGLLLADLHPGNLLAPCDPDLEGPIGVVDFGQCPTLEEPVRRGLVGAIEVARRGGGDVEQAWRELGVPEGRLERLRPALPELNAILCEPFTHGGPWEVPARWPGAPMRVALQRRGLEGELVVPPPLLMVLRAFFAIFHYARILDAPVDLGDTWGKPS